MAIPCAALAQGQPATMLPDLITDENTLYDNVIAFQNGRTLLRLSNGTANTGSGKLELRGGAQNADGTRDVWQRVYRDDGTYWERLAGRFVFHPTHDHIHYDAWAVYRLRTRPNETEIGELVAEGDKTSFCILDLTPYDPTAPGYPAAGQYHSCQSEIQGLSVGWMDVYTRDLEGQTIDITGAPDGDYWLESEVNPGRNITEENVDNNIARIAIVLNNGATIRPDRFEPNESIAGVKTRPIGGSNSPNLGPVGPQGVFTGLSIHKSANPDYFRFYSPGTGTNETWATIEFDPDKGDIDFRLLSDSGSVLAQSVGHTGIEKVGLLGRPRGWYVLQAYGFQSSTHIDYTLTIKPAISAPPSITVLTPPAGDTHLQHGIDTLKVAWDAADPDGDPAWVSVYLCPNRALDGTEVLIPTSVNTPASQGFHIVNSAFVAPGTYWIYAAATDGGTFAGAWSDGTVTFEEDDHEHCASDINEDGFVNGIDFDVFIAAFEAGDPLADANKDTFVSGEDFDSFVIAFEAGC